MRKDRRTDGRTDERTDITKLIVALGIVRKRLKMQVARNVETPVFHKYHAYQKLIFHAVYIMMC
jgi:hypothetical protein